VQRNAVMLIWASNQLGKQLGQTLGKQLDKPKQMVRLAEYIWSHRLAGIHCSSAAERLKPSLEKAPSVFDRVDETDEGVGGHDQGILVLHVVASL